SVVFLRYSLYFLLILWPPRSTLFPYTTLFRSELENLVGRDQILPETVLRVAEFAETLDGDPHLVRPEKRQRQVDHVVADRPVLRSEEHTSELQSRENLVCRLLLEKKNKKDAYD